MPLPLSTEALTAGPGAVQVGTCSAFARVLLIEARVEALTAVPLDTAVDDAFADETLELLELLELQAASNSAPAPTRLNAPRNRLVRLS
jgi:hypothetical protein